MRAVWIVVVCAGCGRLGFDARPTDPGDGDGAPIASLLCDDQRTALGGLPATAELAITASGNGFVAAWTGTGTLVQPPSIARLGAAGPPIVRPLPGAIDPQVVGIVDLGGDLLVAYAETADGLVDVWKLPADLSTATYWQTLAGLGARAPYVTAAGSQRALVSGFQNALLIGDLTPDGYEGKARTSTTAGTVTEIATDDGVDQGVVVWTEDADGGGSRCMTGDVRFAAAVPDLAAPQLVTGDGRHARIAAGATRDARLVVVATAAGAIEAHYLAASGAMSRTITTAGRAPKVRFDGTRFWIVWLDTATGQLRIAAWDPDGSVVAGGHPAPAPIGDEAFQLVRAGATVYLAVLGSDALDLVTLCR